MANGADASANYSLGARQNSRKSAAWNSACAQRGVANVPPFDRFTVWHTFHGRGVTSLILWNRNALVCSHSGTVAASSPKRGGVRTLPFRRLRNSFPGRTDAHPPLATVPRLTNHTTSRFA